jgi:phosphate starvation-inducible PhoH-like protein
VLKGVESIHFTTFTDRDVVRHPIVQAIVQAYQRSRDLSALKPPPYEIP